MANNQNSAAAIANQINRARNSTVSGRQQFGESFVNNIPKQANNVSPSLQRLVQSQLLGKSNGNIGISDVFTDVAAQALASQFNLQNNSLSNVRAPYQPDRRAKLSLSPQSGPILYNDSGILEPLRTTNGMIFPYSPTINATHSAEYDAQSLAHTNFTQFSYARSTADQLQVVGEFTAETQEEGRYLLACIHFLKSATKMFYGLDENRGTPPPVLRFSAYGEHMYHSLPVVVTNSTFDFPNDVDYISVRQPGGSITDVPTRMQLNMALTVVHSRTRTLDFSLKAYASGRLIGDPNGRGGFM